MAKHGRKRGRESQKDDNKSGDKNAVVLQSTISSDEPPKKQVNATHIYLAYIGIF